MTWTQKKDSSWVFNINHSGEGEKGGGHEFDGIPLMVPPNVTQEDEEDSEGCVSLAAEFQKALSCLTLVAGSS